ncbi:adenylyltransferase/cytidyltransferase family protein [Candidatus Uhrbacteria bacterium]|nr:adenylyltransferase/cytidyltransferase family protein [Candidatus Uhrbacteria bacterium]
MAKKRPSYQKKIVVAVSGGFDPVHEGHVRMFQEARALGDVLVVILNNDNWLRKKKGYVFLPQRERKAIIESIRHVDRVFLTKHPRNPSDMSVCRELAALRPDIFANGGDRTRKNIPEVPLCKKIGCRMIFNIGFGGKIQSSSWLVQKCMQVLPCHCGAIQADGTSVQYKHCHGKYALPS